MEKGVILMLNEQDVKRMEEESKLAWERGNVEKAYEINCKLSEEFPQSYMFKVRCMSNLISMKKIDEAKKIYLGCLERMKVEGCGWKLFDTEKTRYLLPMQLKELFFRACLANSYYEELKDEAYEVIEFYCKAGFNIADSKFCRDHGYTIMNGFSSMIFFEDFFSEMRKHGVDVPIFQEAINTYHKGLEDKNILASNVREKIIELNSYEPLKELVEETCYIIDRGGYSYHSLCLNKEEHIDLDKIYGFTNEKTQKRAVSAYMTIKEANSVNPFAISREIKIKDLIELAKNNPNYEDILINYGGTAFLVIPANY